MANFQPLTKDQYQKAIGAGFKPDQIIQNEQKRKQSMTIAGGLSKPQGGFFDAMKNFGNDASQGLIADLSHSAANISKAGGWVQNQVAKLPFLSGLKTDASQNPINKALLSTKAPDTVGGYVGQATGEAAQLLSPTKIISKAQEGLKIASEGSKIIGALPKIGQYAAKTAAHVLPEAGFGAAYGSTRDNATPQSILENSLFFGTASGVFKGFGDAYSAIKGGLGTNVSKALGITGARGTSDLISHVAKSTDALKVIAENATGAIVKDINGVEHAFDPTKATFHDTLQAWKIARDKVYSLYDGLAQKAGGLGAKFTNEDFTNVIGKLRSMGTDTTSAFKNKIDSLIKDLTDNFGVGAQPGKFADVSGDVSHPTYPNKITNLKKTPPAKDLTPPTPQPEGTRFSVNDLRNKPKGAIDLRKMPTADVPPAPKPPERNVQLKGINLSDANMPKKFGYTNVSPTTDKSVVDMSNLPQGAINLRPTLGGSTAMFKDTPLKHIQNFLEYVNTDVNPLSDKAAAQVSGNLSQAIRDILDNKISQYTGEGYQAIRDQYGALKSVEKDLGNQFKKAYRKTSGGLPDYLEGYGGIDAIMGLLSHSPAESIRGGLLAGMGKVFKYLRDPEVKLRNAFDMITNPSKHFSPAAGRAFGLPTSPPINLR